METTQKTHVGKDDYTEKNRMMILNWLVKEWRYRFDELSPQRFNFLDDAAWKIAKELPPELLLQKAITLNVSEILGSEKVQTADTTKSYLSGEEAARFAKQYPIPLAEKKPKPAPHNGAMWLMIAGLVLIVTVICSGIGLLIQWLAG